MYTFCSIQKNVNGSPIDLGIMLRIHGDIEDTTIPLFVDLVDLHTASDAFKNEVKEEGILWQK